MRPVPACIVAVLCLTQLSFGQSIGISWVGSLQFRLEPGDLDRVLTQEFRCEGDGNINIVLPPFVEPSYLWASFNPDTLVTDLGWGPSRTAIVYLRNKNPDANLQSQMNYTSPYKVFLPADVAPTPAYCPRTGYWPAYLDLYDGRDRMPVYDYLNIDASSTVVGPGGIGVRATMSVAMKVYVSPAVPRQTPPSSFAYPEHHVTFLFDAGAEQIAHGDRGSSALGYLGNDETIESSDPTWSEAHHYDYQGNHSLRFDCFQKLIVPSDSLGMLAANPNALNIEATIFMVSQNPYGSKSMLLSKAGEYEVDLQKWVLMFRIWDSDGQVHEFGGLRIDRLHSAWHEVSFVWDGYVACITVDGELYSQDFDLHSKDNRPIRTTFERRITGADLVIGDGFFGNIDELRISDDVLLRGQIRFDESLSVISKPATLPGDTNADGVVDAADYIALKRNFGLGSGATRPQGNFDGDGDADCADLQILMGAMSGGGTSAPAVTPEPATLSLLALGGLAMIRRRRMG